MKKLFLVVTLLGGLSLFSNAGPCDFEATHGEAGTWLEGSCYGTSGSCTGTYPGCEQQ